MLYIKLQLLRVSIGTIEHVLPIIIGFIICISIIIFSKKKLDRTNQWRLVHRIAIFISLFVSSYHLYKISLGNYSLKSDLPLYLCSLLALLIPIFTKLKKYWMFEILVFWIIAGTLQGVITPDIANGFPSFDYFRYWTVHLGLLTVILFIIFVFGWQPKLKSVFKSFLALQVYIIVMLLINFILKSNYFYLNEKPKSRSLLDHFGEWPWYLLIVELLIVPCFLIVYLPFHLAKKRN